MSICPRISAHPGALLNLVALCIAYSIPPRGVFYGSYTGQAECEAALSNCKLQGDILGGISYSALSSGGFGANPYDSGRLFNPNHSPPVGRR